MRRAGALAAAALLLAAAPAVAAGQDTIRAPVLDSLAERLRRAEADIALLREQLATESAAAVKSASRTRVDLFGRVLMNAFTNSGAVNAVDVPLFALPSAAQAEDDGGLGATIRQSSFGVAVAVDRVLGGQFAGELHTDFFGGQLPSTGGRRFPLLRVRTAVGAVRWRRGELLAGQADPLAGGLNPVSVASFGTPEFTAAGNLWLWMPQLRGTLELGSPLGLAVQGAVLAPGSGDALAAFDTEFDDAERSGRPFVQARLRSRWGEPGREGEIGVAVHRGWLETADGSTLTSEAVVADAHVPVGALFELRGELYAGQAVRGLGGGGIGQAVGADGTALRGRGGWVQLRAEPRPWLAVGAGCGLDDPRDEDEPVAGRLRNRACEAHLAARPGGPLVAALAWRGHRTTYTTGVARNHQLNVALGFEF